MDRKHKQLEQELLTEQVEQQAEQVKRQGEKVKQHLEQVEQQDEQVKQQKAKTLAKLHKADMLCQHLEQSQEAEALEAQ